MQVVLYGPNGLPLTPQTAMIVDPTFSAARASIKPLEYAFPGVTFGHYRAVGITAAIAPAASAFLAALRFAPASNSPLAVLTRLRASVAVVTAVTAQRVDALLALIARGYTARDATNATAIALGQNANKVRSSMASAIMGFDVASAAAGLSAGVKAVDANAFGHLPLSGAAAIAGLGTGAAGDLFSWTDLGQHPVVLAANEGALVQWGATALATGTVTVTIEAEWAEALQF